MIHADYRYTLPVSPAEAFVYLSNPSNDAQWQSSCSAVELLTPTPEIGSQYKIIFSFLSRKMNFLAEIIESSSNSNYAFKVIDGPFYYEGRYTLTPHEEGVEVHWQFSAEPGKFFGIIPATILRKVLLSQIESDVVKLRKQFSALQPV